MAQLTHERVAHPTSPVAPHDISLSLWERTHGGGGAERFALDLSPSPLAFPKIHRSSLLLPALLSPKSIDRKIEILQNQELRASSRTDSPHQQAARGAQAQQLPAQLCARAPRGGRPPPAGSRQEGLTA
ncbi:hypothetical protein PVAP13_2KG185900 [Panicum virgatum]|uniref:Uncharacterized protein n=1 Tax=Panicum virgatum TaxID=38727 RepID=A0A8T0WDW3_PANVG|nr:hypothetical protein PVAP13_2KG185900 [Panicum virgatum]